MLRKLLSIFLSFRLTAIVLALFGISIATATFIENDFGSASARAVVYNAKWFEVLLLVGLINMVAVIFKRKLYRKEKLTIFLFHAAFVCILLGAGITRYIGKTGMMHIRQDESKDFYLSDEMYLSTAFTANNDTVINYFKLSLSALRSKHLHENKKVEGHQLAIKTTDYIEHGISTIEYDETGRPLAEMVLATEAGRQIIILENGHPALIGNQLFTLNGDSVQPGVKMYFKDGATQFTAPFEVVSLNMFTQESDTMVANELHTFIPRILYSFGSNQVVLRNIFETAREVAIVPEAAEINHLPSAISGQVTVDGVTQAFTLFGASHQEGIPKMLKFGDVNIAVAYGAKPEKLPFNLQLINFILNRYPGSNSPSWFESKVLLKDEEKNVEKEQRIYMNNVLKYRGYRFYQSSYDEDEQGTVLSVNKDLPGSVITYFGYLVLALGMVLSILNKHSRFMGLAKQVSELQKKKSTLAMLILFIGMNAWGQEQPTSNPVSVEHAKKFGELLILDKSPKKGRVIPINTYASEMLRKISRKQTYNGLIPEQVLLGIISDPAYWQNEPIVKVSHPELQKMLQVSGKYASFNDMFVAANNGQYMLTNYVNEAYRKKAANRSKFDNEIMKVDERLNLLYLGFTAELLNIFPVPNDPANNWVSHVGHHAIQTEDTIFTKNIFRFYIQSLRSAVNTGDYGQADTLLNAIKLYQSKYGGEIMPTEKKVKIELLYNRIHIFDRISNYYGLLGFLLLILLFIGIFVTKFDVSKWVVFFKIAIGLVFLTHLGGLLTRWHISGHAPWSNGYESLIYISWATMLAGFIFSRNSIITLAATSILAFLTLHVAHLSWMDPAITNLVPVLNSYWLIIHVAIITASYGFLALGAMIALLNLIVMFFESEKNTHIITITTKELSAIIEMTLTVGLYMLTIGTFLGGVWANESWGRYWAWDPKETWALVTILVYAFISHMRLIPGLGSRFLFNTFSLFGFASVIMTYFGVNYYLSGLHSYAAGDPLPIPDFVTYTVVSFLAITFLAYFNQRKLNKSKSL